MDGKWAKVPTKPLLQTQEGGEQGGTMRALVRDLRGNHSYGQVAFFTRLRFPQASGHPGFPQDTPTSGVLLGTYSV